MSKQEEIKQALAAATPDWYDNGNEIVSKQNPKVGIGGFLKEEDNRLAAQAPEYIAYLLAENEQLEKRNQELDAWATEGFDENQKLVVEIVRLRKELEEAKQALDTPKRNLLYMFQNERTQMENWRSQFHETFSERERALEESERLRKELEEKEELAEKRLLESQDWEDEYHALKRRYEELDKAALEKHELLMDTSAKFRTVSKELEEARFALEEIAEHGGVNLRGASCAELARAYLGQEGEGNQRTVEVTLSNEGYQEHKLKFDEE